MSRFVDSFIPIMYYLLWEALGVWTGKGEATSIFGSKVGPDLSEADKVWKVFSALGNIALACSFATVIYDIMVSGNTLIN